MDIKISWWTFTMKPWQWHLIRQDYREHRQDHTREEARDLVIQFCLEFCQSKLTRFS